MLKAILITAAVLGLTQPAMAAVKRQAYPLCADEQLRSCIENGSTFWYGGEHVRLRNVSAGGGSATACSEAVDRLRQLLNSGEVFVFRYGIDADGLTRVEVIAQGREVGQVLVGEGLGCQIQS
jgi:hypothetical protein